MNAHETTTKTIFHLERLTWGRQHTYPEFRIYTEGIGYHHTLESAEAAMRCHISTYPDKENYAFYIQEYPLNQAIDGQAQRTRSYRADGTLLAETLVSAIQHADEELDPFPGRPEELCAFRPGDLVEVSEGDSVRLAIVAALPVDPAWVEERDASRSNIRTYFPQATSEKVERAIRRVLRLDYSDDCYLVLYGGHRQQMFDHRHPTVTHVFPLHRRVPKRLRERLERAYQLYSAL